MAGETSLATLLRSMSPQLNAGEYVFCTLHDGQWPAGLDIIGSFREQEGLTVILERRHAEQAGFSFDYVAAWITLNRPQNRNALSAVLVNELDAHLAGALEDPAVRKRIEDTGSVVLGNTPEQFAQQMKDELAVYKKVVETAKLKLE